MTGYENRKPKLAKAQILKYLFEMDALAVPVSRDAIIRGPAGHGSKAIYRHLADLEHEKIIKTTHPKGGKILCKLNGDLLSLANVLDYWISGPEKIKEAVDLAFAECFTSPFGDFLYAGFRHLGVIHDGSFLSLRTKIYELVKKGIRPSFDKDELETINWVAAELRGPMDTFYKLMYMAQVLKLYEMPDENFNTLAIFVCTVLNLDERHFFARHAQEAATIGPDAIFLWGYSVLWRIAEISSHMTDRENGMHFLGKVTEREQQVREITWKREGMQLLTVDEFTKSRVSRVLERPYEAWSR
ncbi:hypothetical protein Thermo_00114 [Thermoplasmatales archaeon]|nr:hypothetical protein Thermo_00114 [Thermoplasmatales archaeon]